MKQKTLNVIEQTIAEIEIGPMKLEIEKGE